MIDLETLGFHAGQALKNDALLQVRENLQADALRRIMDVTGWRWWIVHRKRQMIIDETKAIDRIFLELDLMRRAGEKRKPLSVA